MNNDKKFILGFRNKSNDEPQLIYPFKTGKFA
jgi:hypothetical protein